MKGRISDALAIALNCPEGQARIARQMLGKPQPLPHITRAALVGALLEQDGGSYTVDEIIAALRACGVEVGE